MDFNKSYKEFSDAWTRDFTAIKACEKGKRYNAIVKYLKLLRDAYEYGLIGYMYYPQHVISLFAIDDISDYREFDDIFDLAGELDIPYRDRETNPRTRLDDNEKLSKMIESLPKK